GARWSYDVLGWGGYWAWDPVENAAFMPWLVATAFIHSSMVQERRRLLRIWNVSLVILAFLLTIFGPFLTRSGILASVHSFTQSLIGPVFVAFVGLVMVASFLALLARRPQIRDEGGLDSPLSREAMMLLNNVVLLTMAFTIFVGTIFPLIVEAATGAKVTVGPPFFNRLFVPLGIVLLMVMGLGTALRWGRSGAEEMRKLGWLIGITLLTVTALGFAGIRGGGVVGVGWGGGGVPSAAGASGSAARSGEAGCGGVGRGVFREQHVPGSQPWIPRGTRHPPPVRELLPPGAHPGADASGPFHMEAGSVCGDDGVRSGRAERGAARGGHAPGVLDLGGRHDHGDR